VSTAVAKVAPLVPEPFSRRGVDESQWRTLANNLYPGASQDSVLMVVDYCRARGLDPMKKPCHIVPMRVKQGGDYVTRDVVMPGIYEYRTTAHRTGQYLGRTSFTYGPRTTYKGQAKDPKYAGVDAPEWAEATFKRATPAGTAEFTVRRYFAEVVGTEWKSGEVNDRWTKAPTQMLEKCVEAAGLREAFPEDIGGEATMEEMEGQTVVHEPPPPPIQQPQRKAEAREMGATAAAIDVQPARPAAPDAEAAAAVVEAEVVKPDQSAQPADAVTIADALERTSRSGQAYWSAKDSRGRYCLTLDAEIGRKLIELKGTDHRVVLTLTPVEGQQVPSVTEIEVVS